MQKNAETKLKELPKAKVQEILDGINRVGEREILVNVSRRKEKIEEEFVFYFLINMNTLIRDP